MVNGVDKSITFQKTEPKLLSGFLPLVLILFAVFLFCALEYNSLDFVEH